MGSNLMVLISFFILSVLLLSTGELLTKEIKNILSFKSNRAM